MAVVGVMGCAIEAVASAGDAAYEGDSSVAACYEDAAIGLASTMCAAIDDDIV